MSALPIEAHDGATASIWVAELVGIQFMLVSATLGWESALLKAPPLIATVMAATTSTEAAAKSTHFGTTFVRIGAAPGL
jgi:hypothetical protein